MENARCLGGAVLIAALTAAIYCPVLLELMMDWFKNPDYSHGFLVPVFAAYVAWSKRDILLATEITSDWRGIAVIALGLSALVLGVLGAELFLARVSFLIVMTGMVLCFGGPRLLTELRFILLVLLLAIPIPAIVFSQVTFPLQILASRLAGALLPLCGIPVLRQGNILQLPLMKLEVAEACSGIRSLTSLFTLLVFYLYFWEKSWPRRALLAVACIPVAIAANALRIVGTGLCVQYWNPDKAMGFFHEFSGWVMFLVSLSCLLLAHRAVRCLPLHRGKP